MWLQDTITLGQAGRASWLLAWLAAAVYKVACVHHCPPCLPRLHHVCIRGGHVGRRSIVALGTAWAARYDSYLRCARVADW